MPRRGSGERGVPRARASRRSALPEATCPLGRERGGREVLSKLRSRNVQRRRWRGGGSRIRARPGGFGCPFAPSRGLDLSFFSLPPSSSPLSARYFSSSLPPPREISKARPRPAPEFATKLRVTGSPLGCWSVGTGSLSLGRLGGLPVPLDALLQSHSAALFFLREADSHSALPAREERAHPARGRISPPGGLPPPARPGAGAPGRAVPPIPAPTGLGAPTRFPLWATGHRSCNIEKEKEGGGKKRSPQKNKDQV